MALHRRSVLSLAALALVVLGVLAGPARPASAATFANTAPITIPDPNCTDPDAATPYPSNISVSGLTGTITDVNVTLTGVTHPFQGDLDLLLVGPSGGSQNLTLLSDAGTGSLSNATVVFDDSAAALAPQNSAWPPGPYKPTNYTEVSGADVFPAPAPAPSANTTLAAFNGLAPNGTWSLYVIDDACPDAGSIGGGWSLDITTAASAAQTGTTVTSSLNPSRTGQSVTFTALVVSANTVSTGTVTFTDGGAVLASNVPVNGSGQAAFTTSTLAEGNHLVKATYNGTALFATSNDTVDQRVDNNTTATGNQYCNTGPITIADNATATPYPSNVFVTGAGTNPAKVTVTLKNVTHAFDGDIEALLVGPAGQNLVVVSDAGTAGITNVTVNLDDAAASLLPAAGAWAAANATVSAKPTNYNELVADTFPAPAPAPSAATTLATFNGVNPNGTWRLFVKDDGAPDGGSIAGGWCLNLTPASATPTLSTTASPSVVVGGQVSDTATLGVANNPTGTISFNLYGPNNATCATPAVFTSTKTVAGNGSYTSDPFTTTASGTYRWTANYSGDANNAAVSTACNDPNESVIVTAPPVVAIVTQAIPSATIGDPISDTATVNGAGAGSPPPTGTVTFSLFGPNNATCTGVPVFTSAAQPLAGGPPPTASSGPFTPTVPGTYRWVAAYSGDANYNPATSSCNAANETSTVNPAPVTIATQATPTVTVGGPISDTATVTGAPSPAPPPTGTVVFTLFGPNNATCTGVPVFTSAAQPLAGGPPPTASSGPFTPTVPGTYRWVAAYSGDVSYTPVTSPCNAANETSTVNQATATIATTALSPVTIGSPIRDTATVTGAPAPAPTPTGTVTFTVFGPNNATCTGAPVFTSAARPLGGGPPRTAVSADFVPPAVGAYRWVAVYSGDANYPSVTSPCNAANETSTVNQAVATIATTALSPVTIGSPIRDTATVTGAPAPAPTPTGTVTFTVFGPNNATCTGAPVFTSAARPLGGGPPRTAVSADFVPPAVGAYRWVAVYSGDANYLGATSPCNAANEMSTVTKATPTIATQASAGGIVGIPARDVATLAGGANPTGNVTFRLFSDTICTTQVFTSTNNLAGLTATSGDFTPAAPGTYRWTAVYNGDANNNPATSPCNAPNESVVITPFQAPPFTRTVTGDLPGPVTVTRGESVLISSARVQGPVTVEPGGALTVVSSKVNKPVIANAPAFFSMCGSDVAGPPPATALSVTGAPVPIRVGDPASGCAGNRFAGQVNLTGNLAVTFGANTVSHNATIDNNGGGNTVVKANTVFGTLGCAGNAPPPTNAGQPNTAGTKTGQCAAL